MRAAALRAANSRDTRQVFDELADQLHDSAYCCKEERPDELIPTKLCDIFIRPALRCAACRMHSQPPSHTSTSLTTGLTGAAQRPRARASGTRTPAYLPRSPAWLCSELSCLRPALSCLQLL